MLVLKGVTDQEAVERLTAAIEGFQQMVTLEFFNPKRIGHLLPPALEYAGLLKQPGKTRRGRRRGIERSLKDFPLLGVQTKPLAIRQRFLSPGQGAFENKLADGPACGGGGNLQSTLGRRREA